MSSTPAMRKKFGWKNMEKLRDDVKQNDSNLSDFNNDSFFGAKYLGRGVRRLFILVKSTNKEKTYGNSKNHIIAKCKIAILSSAK